MIKQIFEFLLYMLCILIAFKFSSLNGYIASFILAICVPFISNLLSYIIELSPQEQQSLDESINKNHSKIKKSTAKSVFNFSKHTFQIAGHLSTADTNDKSDEDSYLLSIFSRLQFNDYQAKIAKNYFNEGKSSGFNLSNSIREIKETSTGSDRLLINFLEIQFEFAYSNNKITIAEYRILEVISRSLGLYKKFSLLLQEYSLLAREHAEQTAKINIENRKREQSKQKEKQQREKLNGATNKSERKILIALAILGVSKGASITEIKKAYRKQIKLHHPDTLIANKYPTELLIKATERSAKINDSYNLLKKYYKFK